MGIYGTYGAFNGLGKPSIKLEFEDNEALLDFQRRMQEGGNDDPGDTPDGGGNFTPPTYTQEQLDNAVKNHTVTGWGIFPEIPDGWQLVKTSAAPKGFNVITKGEPSFEMTTEGWKFKHSLDAALIEKKKGLKVVKGGEEPVEGVKQNKEAFLKEIYSYTEKLTPKEFSYSLLEKELGKDKDGVYNIKNSSLANSKSNVAEAEKLIKYYKMFYSDPSKYDLLDKAYGGNYNNIREKVIDVAGRDGVKLDGVTLGKTANDALYNNLEILDFRGMRPTYKQLPNYDAFFKPAANKNSLKGWGLNDTKKLIADICRNHYKECAAIAQHLKAETKLQSAFNLWHWLHHNIRYEYDREGREEVRTPARTWADRHRGVDCDCLSVFVWCVLKCMGYNPAFELAAFKNKPAYSHIYINLDGIVIDRVWFVFNSRPPGVTKTELFKVGMLDNLGQLF